MDLKKPGVWGGTSGSCFSDSLSTISPEIEPELKTLDEFFIEFYPQISFMQYKVISSFIDKDTFSDHDYYGGSTTHGKKQLTIQFIILLIKGATGNQNLNSHIRKNSFRFKISSLKFVPRYPPAP